MSFGGDWQPRQRIKRIRLRFTLLYAVEVPQGFYLQMRQLFEGRAMRAAESWHLLTELINGQSGDYNGEIKDSVGSLWTVMRNLPSRK